jgi:RimJ/RimL family protein N-acetyltransferase
VMNLTNEIPTLETARLILRGPTRGDFAAYAAQGSDPSYMRHMGDGSPRSEEDSWSSLLRVAGIWQLMGFGTWIVEDKATGAFAGSVGYIERKRDRGPDLKDIPELGWGIASRFAGQGYATEALNVALKWGRENLGPIRVIAAMTDDNHASRRVAEKCGFKEFYRGPSAGRPRVFFERML